MDEGSLSLWELFGLGIVGGIFAELVTLLPYKRRTFLTWPKFLKQRMYWVFVIVWIVVGGVASVLSLTSVTGYSLWIPVQIGMTAPLLLERLGSSLPDNSPGKVG